MNRSTIRSDVIDYMDAQDSERWETAIVDRRISSVYDAIWRDILNANPNYRLASRMPTSDASGRYAKSDLSIIAGDGSQRLYRVVQVNIDGYTYDGPVSFKEYAPKALYGTYDNCRVWYEEGNNIVALPIQASKTADAFWVNYIPARFEELEADDSSVDFPDGHEEVLIGYAAARLLTKGGAETQAATEIKQELLPEYKAMLADVCRVGTSPIQIAYQDLSQQWGG